MAYETEVDADVVGWICHKMHDGTWQLRLFGRMDYNSNAGEDILNIDMRKFWLDTEERNRKRDRWKRE